jgi:hypothetical protein
MNTKADQAIEYPWWCCDHVTKGKLYTPGLISPPA